MPCTVDFGVIDQVEPFRDYSVFSGPGGYRDSLEEFRCISVADDIANEFIPLAGELPTYLFSLQKPFYGIDHYGVTLIPPGSVQKLADVIETNRGRILRPEIILQMEAAPEAAAEEIRALLSLLRSAGQTEMYVICYGV